MSVSPWGQDTSISITPGALYGASHREGAQETAACHKTHQMEVDEEAQYLEQRCLVEARKVLGLPFNLQGSPGDTSEKPGLKTKGSLALSKPKV